MSWVALDDKFHSNPKIIDAGNAAIGFYARALSYCADHLTDGYVSPAWVREAGSKQLANRLVEHDLWIEVKGGESFEYEVDGSPYVVEIVRSGYFIPDYVVHNPTRAAVEKRRSELSQKRAEAGRKGALRRWQKA